MKFFVHISCFVKSSPHFVQWYFIATSILTTLALFISRRRSDSHPSKADQDGRVGPAGSVRLLRQEQRRQRRPGRDLVAVSGEERHLARRVRDQGGRRHRPLPADHRQGHVDRRRHLLVPGQRNQRLGRALPSLQAGSPARHLRYATFPE